MLFLFRSFKIPHFYRHAIRYAGEASSGSWHMRQLRRSPAYTTRWQELPQVRSG